MKRWTRSLSLWQRRRPAQMGRGRRRVKSLLLSIRLRWRTLQPLPLLLQLLRTTCVSLCVREHQSC